MKKKDQIKINEMVSEKYDVAIAEFRKWQVKNPYIARLRSCTAWVIETQNYCFLQSYNTIVAFIDKEDDILYDVLRLVYGYTHTSAQHIAKFNQDCCRGYWGCGQRYTWREV